MKKKASNIVAVASSGEMRKLYLSLSLSLSLSLLPYVENELFYCLEGYFGYFLYFSLVLKFFF